MDVLGRKWVGDLEEEEGRVVSWKSRERWIRMIVIEMLRRERSKKREVRRSKFEMNDV